MKRPYSRRRKLASLAVVALASLLPLRAMADTGEAAEARHRYQEGASAFSKGDYAAAAEAFADVYRVTGQTKHLWSLAAAEWQAGRAFDALVHMRLYITKPDAKPEDIERARKIIPEAEAQIGHLTVVAPDGADVLLDGARVGTAPLPSPLEVDPAKPHVLRAQRGSDAVEQTVGPTGARTMGVDLAFPERPPPPPLAPAATTQAPPPVEASSAERSAHAQGSSARFPVSLSIAGAGAASFIGAAVFFAMNESNLNHVHALQAQLSSRACDQPSPQNAGPCADLRSSISNVNTYHDVSIVLDVVGGALVGVGVLTYLLWPTGGHKHDARGALVPLLAPGQAGAGYLGTF